MKECSNCKKTIKGDRKTCSRKCMKEYRANVYIERWLKGLETGMRGKTALKTYIRDYLFAKYQNKCSKCGWNKISISTNKIPLEVNHIDGNYTNNTPENLELLCPNCHSLTDSYRSLNKGKGRPYIRGRTR